MPTLGIEVDVSLGHQEKPNHGECNGYFGFNFNKANDSATVSTDQLCAATGGSLSHLVGIVFLKCDISSPSGPNISVQLSYPSLHHPYRTCECRPPAGGAPGGASGETVDGACCRRAETQVAAAGAG